MAIPRMRVVPSRKRTSQLAWWAQKKMIPCPFAWSSLASSGLRHWTVSEMFLSAPSFGYSRQLIARFSKDCLAVSMICSLFKASDFARARLLRVRFR